MREWFFCPRSSELVAARRRTEPSKHADFDKHADSDKHGDADKHADSDKHGDSDKLVLSHRQLE